MSTSVRGRLAWLAAAVTVPLTALVVGLGGTASAATLFSDDFEDGNSSGWTTSGGTWAVADDGSRVLQQSGTSSDARARAGSSSWTDYTVTARVKLTAVNGTNRFAAFLARTQSDTSYYYVALRTNNTVGLKKLFGNRAKKSGMVNITSSVNSRERSGINTILHELNPLFTINVTMRDIKSKNVYSRVNSKATTQWRKTESANGVHLEGVASDNRSS